MKLSNTLIALFGLTAQTFAASSFIGSNLYYAAGLNGDEQTTLLQGLSDAGVKVLRVWLDGETSPQKGTSFTSYPYLESTSGPGNEAGCTDDVLNNLDDFMATAYGYGIKVLVSIHSYNALEGDKDFYGKYYGTGNFYTDENAIEYYKERIAHVMAHVNPHNGKPWSQSSEYIFAFETQNEAMHDNENPTALQSWQCEIAGAIKGNLQGSTDILVATGGASYLATSLQDGYFTCDNLDVLSIHAYGTGDYDVDTLKSYVTRAQNAGKKLLMQEWGMCYYDTANNNCPTGDALPTATRNSNIEQYADQISQAGIPWMYWQIIPNEDGHTDSYDYEIGVNGVNWDTFKTVGKGTQNYTAAFDFSAWLL